LWDEIFQILGPIEQLDQDTLAEMLSKNQWKFEQIHLDRSVAQEIMVVSGIAPYYMGALGEGRGGQMETEPVYADIVYLAFKHSSCSLEIKSCADTIAQFYGLIPDYLRKKSDDVRTKLRSK